MSPTAGVAPSSGTPAPSHHKRRQYAPGQTQAYYGAGDGLNGGGYGGGGAPPPQPGQLFTPGLAAENQFQQQQQQQQQMQPGGQPPYYAGATAEPEYINAPQAPMYGQPQSSMNTLVDQFGQMGMGQKGLRLYTTNLLTSPPDPRELHQPPPEIVLPPNSCVSPSPLANADIPISAAL